MRTTPLLGGLLASILATGCAGETWTIAELGHPAFSEQVGAETRFERPDPKEVRGLNAHPTSGYDEEASHRLLLSFWPVAAKNEEEKVDLIAITVKARPAKGAKLKSIMGAVFALQAEDVPAYSAKGTLPDPSKAIPMRWRVREEKEVKIFEAVIKRDLLPPGTKQIAMPTMVQFADGWIYIRFYSTMPPEPMRILSEEESRKLLEERKKQADPTTKPAGPKDPPASRPSENGSKEEPPKDG